MRVTTFASGERGSIPLAMLVIIIMAGLTSVLLARSVAEQRSTRFDNEFTTTLHAGEAGIDEAVFRLNNQLVTGNTASGSGDAGGYAYTWKAERDGFGQWTVTSTGEGPDRAERTVVAEVNDKPLFDLALATHLGINFQGGNTADSYHSGLQRRCSVTADPDCFGIVASNGNIDMGSTGPNTNYADRVRVHDMANPANNGPERCGPSNSIYCSYDYPFRNDIDDPLDIHADVPFVEELLDGCSSFPDWQASDVAPGNNDTAILDLAGVGEATHPDIGAYHCLGDVHFDRDTVLPASVSLADPLYIVVRDAIKIDGHTKVNCASCGGSFPPDPDMPLGAALQIFTLAEDGGQGSNVLAAVQIRQQAKLGASLYAPDASCGNQQGSNAQVEIYGSLICKAVLNQGGWGFHYDESLLGGLRTGRFFVNRWREE